MDNSLPPVPDIVRSAYATLIVTSLALSAASAIVAVSVAVAVLPPTSVIVATAV